MVDFIKKFNEVYGAKPIFAGVYTNKSVELMCEETKLFLENGIHVYIEPIRFRKDATLFFEDLQAIETVLQNIGSTHSKELEKNKSKIGINFQFRPDESCRLAQNYGLSFIANDAFIGEYVHREEFCDKNNKILKPNLQRVLGTYLFAGITPGYLINQSTDSVFGEEMQKLNFLADAILVGNHASKNVLDQLIEYKQTTTITKPLIAAQGVDSENLKNLLYFADGAIIGSGFRRDGLVSLDKIKEIKELQRQTIQEIKS